MQNKGQDKGCWINETKTEETEDASVSVEEGNHQRLDENDTIRLQKLRHIEVVYEGKGPRQCNEPTFRELKESLQLLQERWPCKDVHKMIRMLHRNLVINGSQNRERQPTHWLELSKNDVEQYNNTPRKFRLKNPIKEKRAVTAEDEQALRVRKVVAKTLADRGYGIAKLKQELAQNGDGIVIKRKQYRNFVRAICVSTYRLVEYFLVSQCRRNIKTINKYEINALQPLLFHARLSLPQDLLLTFLKFLRISEHLGNVAISEHSAMRLYNAFQTFLKARVGPKHLDQDILRNTWGKYKRKKDQEEYCRLYKEDFQAFMTAERKEEMLKLYRTYHTPQKLRRYYQQIYPDRASLFKTSEVHLKLNQMLRIAFKKFLFLCRAYGGDLIYEDKRDSKLIYNHSEGLPIRLQLIDLFFDSTTDLVPRLRRLANQLNEYLSSKTNERLNYTIQNIQPIGPVTQKIEYNLKQSRSKQKEKHRYYAQEVVLKGKERNYNHFINPANGLNIHYYRACEDQNKKDELETTSGGSTTNEVKLQEGSEQYLKAMEQKRYQLMNWDNVQQLLNIDKQIIRRMEIQVKQPVYKISPYQALMKDYMQKIGLCVHKLANDRTR